MIKLWLYVFITPIVILAVDSININFIFKKNKVLQARVFYVILTFCLSYLLVNFVYDILGVSSLY